MMRQATLLAVLVTVAQLSFAHSGKPTSRWENPFANAVNDPIKKPNGDSILASIPQPREVLAEITNVMGLHTNFELKSADVLNIQASISRNKRMILYNPEYINWINQLTRDKWCVTALIAHEVGHHLNGHTIRKGGSSPGVELEADEFAGFVLFKLGASLEDAQKVMNYIAGMDASETHPGRMARKQAIQRGWVKAGGELSAVAAN
jgi:hypothetical protein